MLKLTTDKHKAVQSLCDSWASCYYYTAPLTQFAITIVCHFNLLQIMSIIFTVVYQPMANAIACRLVAQLWQLTKKVESVFFATRNNLTFG